MTHRWNQVLLVALLLGQLVLLSTNPRARGSTLERFMLSTVGPIARQARLANDGMANVFDSFRLASSLREDNQRLRLEIETMRNDLVRLHSVEEELAKLSRVSSYTRQETGDFYVADVVFVDDASWLRTLVLYTGSANPNHNQPVVTDEGLVGRVIVPADPYAKVLLITDRSASVSAMNQRTRRRGMVRGAGGGLLLLDNIPLQEDVRPGDRIVTAGIDGVFPRGIAIGVVTDVEPGHELFHRIRIRPHIDFALLDQVYVLTKEIVPSAIKEALSSREQPDG